MKQWTKIDKTVEHVPYLTENDLCYYYLIHTSDGYEASNANSRIANFKKDIQYRNNQNVWRYKSKEIECFADDVINLLSSNGFRKVLGMYVPVSLVPMPTSTPKTDQDYDSRLEVLCKIISSRLLGTNTESVFDVKEKVPAAHAGGSRNVSFLSEQIVMEPFRVKPNLVILIDDVITTGAHYKVCKDKIKMLYGDMPIIGLFLSIHKSVHINYGGTSLAT